MVDEARETLEQTLKKLSITVETVEHPEVRNYCSTAFLKSHIYFTTIHRSSQWMQ